MGNRMPIPDERLSQIVENIGLEDRDLAKLWRVFRKCDKERNGTITRNQFFLWLGERRTAFGDNLFEVVDLDCDSEILDFTEFVLVVSTYCMFGPEDVIQFCFYCFDKEKKGTIDKDELISLIEMLHASGKNSNVKKAIKKLDLTLDGKVPYKSFQAINKESPQLIFPAFRLQNRMKQLTLGESKWITKKRTLAVGREKSKRIAEQNEKLKAKRRVQQAKREKIIMAGGVLPYYLQKLQHLVNPYVSTAEQLKTELQQNIKSVRNLEDLEEEEGKPKTTTPAARKKRKDAKTGQQGAASKKPKKAGASSSSPSKENGKKGAKKKKKAKSTKIVAGG